MTGIYTPHSAVTSHRRWGSSTLQYGMHSVKDAVTYINYRRQTYIFQNLEHDWRAFLTAVEWDLITHYGVNPAQIMPEPKVYRSQVV